MALVQHRKTTAQAVVDSRIMRLGSRLSQEYIVSIKAKNDSVWNDRKSWILGFYFGAGDERLWVPRRAKGEPDPERMIINFAHPKGKQAARVLMLAYLVCKVGAVLVIAMYLGYSW